MDRLHSLNALNMDSPLASRSDLSEVTARSKVRSRNGHHATAGQPAESSARPSHVASIYAPIADGLAAVERRLHAELQSPHEALVPVLRHGTQLGGKRLRPAMLLLAAAAAGEINDDHIVLGTVIEMVHTATLIHDDVLDEAVTRRHVPTINARWNNHTSILLGDYLFAQSFRLAATLESTEACRWIGEASRRVCEGELRQVLARDDVELDESTYLEMIRAKTAELCRVACMLGARQSGADERTVARLGEFGEAVGIAFQITDDYLDLWGDDDTIGKTLGSDLEQGKLTLPLIRLLDTSGPTEREQIAAILDDAPLERGSRLREWLVASDAAAYTASTAQAHCQDAMNALDGLRPSPALESLRNIAKFAINRQF